MNILDRAIAFFDPAAGVRRASARVTLDQVRHYDGAKVGRRTAGWQATNASANVTIKGGLPMLRARSRDITRNTWWGNRIRSVFVSHSVGAGIMPKVNTGNKKLDRKAKAAWKAWGKVCDGEGQLNIDGLIALATGCVIESGEVLAHMVPTKLSARPGVVPLELRLLEPDHLDASRDRVMMVTRPPNADINAEGVVVDQGVEYSLDGKRKAYWIYPVHPGARGLVMPSASKRIDARDMLHAYRKDRIGQGRGVPWVAPIMLKGRDVADLEEAVVVKSRIEACLAAFIKTNDTSRTLAQKVTNERTPDGGTRRIETLSPGMIQYLEQGEDLQTVSPSSSIQFESVLMSTWLTLAAGAGITYDQLTGDLRRANFSSLRAGKIEFRRLVEQFQWHTIVAMLLDPLWTRWCEAAMDAGILPRRAGGYPVEWIMPANEPIDPLKDMEADILAVRSGRMTWPQFVAAWGIDPDVQLDEIAEWFAEIDRRKIVLDTDPRLALTSTKGGAKDESNTEVNNDTSKRANDPHALPMQTRAVPVGSIDTEKRTVEVTFTTGATVRRMRYSGWDTAIPFDETLEVSERAINMDRLNSGAPALDSHSSYSTWSQVGAVERAWIEGKEGRALIRFPSKGVDESADRMFALVAERIITKVSVGYSIDEVRVVTPEKVGEVEKRIVTRWTPYEISFVTIPADNGAQTRATADQYPVVIARSVDGSAAAARMRMRQSSI